METAPVGAPVAVLDERNGATRRSMPEVASGSSFSVRRSVFEVSQFTFHLLPRPSILGRRDSMADDRPGPGKFRVEAEKTLLLLGQFGIRDDRVDRANRLAKRAIDTRLWIDDEAIGPFMKTAYRTYLHAIGIFAFDATIRDHHGHCFCPLEGEEADPVLPIANSLFANTTARDLFSAPGSAIES